MTKKIVAGNWKMNLNYAEAMQLHADIEKSLIKNKYNCNVFLFAPAIYLQSLTNSSENITIGAQNGYPQKNGAFTGEISMHQLSSIGTKAILIGHSERRQLFHETNDFLKEKVNAALKENLSVFFCCGEDLKQRESGTHENFVINQLKESLFHLEATDLKKIIIAYEPIWAIGTGKTATSDQANSMHKSIRSAIAQQYSNEIAQNIPILYGGSCNPANAEDLFSQSDIDGGLIGGASLKPDDFLSIIFST